jgi:hypothetical protein
MRIENTDRQCGRAYRIVDDLRIIADGANLGETSDGIKLQIRGLSFGRSDRALWGISCTFNIMVFWKAALRIDDEELE